MQSQFTQISRSMSIVYDGRIVVELDGWVEENYDEWRRLLAEIFSLEAGLAE